MSSRHFHRLIILCLLIGVASARGDEENVWPLYVRQRDVAGGTESLQALGPLIFSRSGQAEQTGLRPLVMGINSPGTEEGNLLYPFFTWRQQTDGSSAFSFFQLVNSARNPAEASAPAEERFDAWPFYFSRDTGDPTTSYRAFFPFGGTIKNRFGRDRIDFTLFPFYSRTQKSAKVVTHTPWPFIRTIQGEGHAGFEFWPFYGHSRHEGDYDRQFWLWPLGYKSVANLSEPVPDVKIGALPFYSRDTGPGYIRENYIWPFFGYSHVSAPYHYDEQRYFWPFFVQGKGDSRRVNRWAPFYTHSVIKGTEKTWLLWPLYRNQTWQADGVAQEKNTLLFFVYWSLEQHSLANPSAPAARKTHLWPLYSEWDNGAGRRQVQVLSPIEVFFPRNEVMRQLWSPLFAVYRYDHQPDNSVRHSLLWDAVTWRRTPTDREFHLGPLFSVQANPDGRRIALGNGLLGLQRNPAGRWRFFLFDFPSKANQANPATLP